MVRFYMEVIAYSLPNLMNVMIRAWLYAYNESATIH